MRMSEKCRNNNSTEVKKDKVFEQKLFRTWQSNDVGVGILKDGSKNIESWNKSINITKTASIILGEESNYYFLSYDTIYEHIPHTASDGVGMVYFHFSSYMYSCRMEFLLPLISARTN